MLNVQLLDNSLIEQWGMWGFGDGRVNLRTHKARGGGGGGVKTKLWVYWGNFVKEQKFLF